MSIDLHVHSINSDGTETVEAILESAVELQLEAICISDHEYLTKVPKHNEIEISQGAEISVSWDLLDRKNKFGAICLLAAGFFLSFGGLLIRLIEDASTMQVTSYRSELSFL